MIKCPNCSAQLKFDVNDQEIKCDYCGSKFNPKELNSKIQKSEEQEIIDSQNSYEGKSYTCSQCGATLLTFDETAITFCSYCGSQAMIESKMIKINNPDYIIPFKKTKEECINNYVKKLRKSFFAPNYMKQKIVVDKFRGIYMPYAIYKVSYHNHCSNTGSVYICRKGDYIYYDDYSIVSKVDSDYDGISYDLISKFYNHFSQSIPFKIKERENFNINYLSGFYADTKDININSYDRIVNDIVKIDVNKRLKSVKEYRKYNCTNPNVPMEVSERKIGMFPVYFLAIRDKKNEHINYAVINGQTGKVAADIPIDFKKYIIITLILALVIFLIINGLLVIIPKYILYFSLACALISGMISNYQLNKMSVRKAHIDDLGFVTKNEEKYKEEIEDIIESKRNVSDSNNKTKGLLIALIMGALTWTLVAIFADVPKEMVPALLIIFFIIFGLFIGLRLIGNVINNERNNFTSDKVKMSFKEKLKKYLYKQFIGLFIGVLIIVLNPVNDIYYYGAAILVSLMVILSFKDLVTERNEIISHPIPQLEKRGGDENE